MDQAVKVDSKLLEEVKYFSTGVLSQQVQSLLGDGGAKCLKYSSDMMSHCIAGEDADISAIEEVRDIFEKPVVSSSWVTMSVHAQKLLPVEPFDPKLPQIFKKVTASISQVSRSDAKKLWALLEIYGGKLKPTFNSSCTHLICGKGTGAKYEEGLKRSSVSIVTPDWIISCIAEKTLLPVEGYHPSLLIDPTKAANSASACAEEIKVLKLEPEKVEDVKLPPAPVVPPVPSKQVETRRNSETAMEAPAKKEVRTVEVKISDSVNQPPQPTVTTTNPRMRVASNLPPHLEQQLQQHSMMRNTAPRQQGQAGVRMVRSVSGAQGTWRAANQQQQVILQRSVSHPGNQAEQRPQQQTMRPTYTVQQIRPPNAQQTGTGEEGKVQHLIVSQQLGPNNNQQVGTVQHIGMVRQVKLVNQQGVQQQQIVLQPQQQQQTAGTTDQGSGQQTWVQLPNARRQMVAVTPQLLQQAQVRPQQQQQSNNLQQNVQTVQTQQNFTQQSGQYPQPAATSQPQIAPNSQPMQVQYMQPGIQQQVQNQATSFPPGQATECIQQQQPESAVQHQYVVQQTQPQAFQQDQQTRSSEASSSESTQVMANQQHFPVQQQAMQHQQPIQQQSQQQSVQPAQQQPAAQHVQQVGQQLAMQQQQQQHIQQQQPVQQQQVQQQQTMQQQPMQQQVIRQPGPGQVPGGVRPGMQVGPNGQPVQQQPPRHLTPQQQQLLQIHIQNMSPQQRQQLQQLTPQMRYTVLQKILAQQEMLQQQQQAKRLHQQQQAPGPVEEGGQQAPNAQQQQEMIAKRQQMMQQQQQQQQQQQHQQQQLQQQQQQQQLQQQQQQQQHPHQNQIMVQRQMQAPVRHALPTQQQPAQMQQQPQQQIHQQQQMQQQQQQQMPQQQIHQQQQMQQQQQQHQQQMQQQLMQQQQHALQQAVQPQPGQQPLTQQALQQQQQPMQQLPIQQQSVPPQLIQQQVIQNPQAVQQQIMQQGIPQHSVAPQHAQQQGNQLQQHIQHQQVVPQIPQQAVQQRLIMNAQNNWQQHPDQQQSMPNQQVMQVQQIQLQPQAQSNGQQPQQFQQPVQQQQIQQLQAQMQLQQQIPQGTVQPNQVQPAPVAAQIQQQQQEQQSNSVNPKTKTALANLLSTRLQTAPPAQQQQQPAAPQQFTPQQHQMMSQQQQQQQQQRRGLQNITNGAGGQLQQQNSPLPVSSSPAIPQQVQQPMPQQQQQVPGKVAIPPGTQLTGVRMPVNPVAGQVAVVPQPGQPGGPTMIAVRREFPAGAQQPMQAQVQPPQQHQLFGHEPGVKIPDGLCLLGCVFLIVDYQRTVPTAEIQKWVKLMNAKGAEVEATYSPRVTHVLCETSRSPVVQQALREGKRLITAFWLNDTIVKDQLFPPTLVLHFPTPYADTDRPCKGMLVSVSGFEGEERARVRYICESVGLTCTGHFSGHHDLLVCRKPDGHKYQKAREWRKPVVSLNWLAEVHFGFVNALQQMHHPKYQQFNLPAYVQDPFKFELNMAGSLLAAWRIPIKVTPEVIDKANKNAAGVAARLQMRNKRVSSTNSNPGDSPTKKKARIQDPGDGSNGSEADRSASGDKSSSNLDAILDDVAKGGFDAEGKPRPLVRFSGMEAAEWSKNLLRLGGSLASTNKEATHLVMPALVRTPKLLSCIPSVKFILTPQWIKDSLQHGKLLDEQPYIHKDTGFGRLGSVTDFSLIKLLSTPNRDQLFKGKTFYITPSVVPSRSVLREIIENSGGKVASQRKSLKAINEVNQMDDNAYIVISCAADLHLIADLIKSKIGVYHSEYVMSAVLSQTIVGPPFLMGP